MWSTQASATPDTGLFFVHYLALTFSTLLSSQVSGAHRTGLVCSGLGQRPTLRGLASPSQTRTFWFIHDHQSPDLMCLSRAHIYPNISLASGFLPGRPLQIDDLTRPAPPLRPHILYACAADRSNGPTAVHPQASIVETPSGLLGIPRREASGSGCATGTALRPSGVPVSSSRRSRHQFIWRQ